MDNQSKDTAKKELNDSQVVLMAGFGVLVLLVGLAFLVHMRVPIPHNSEVFTQDDWQAFADMFGAVAGTVVSAFAFVALIYTSWMQRKELALQREQLKENQAELKRQADAQEGSGKILSSQVDVARLSAQLSAAQALYGYYATILMNSRQIPKTDRVGRYNFLSSYRDKVAAYDSSNLSGAKHSPFRIEQELMNMQAALEVQIDETVRDMQRVQAELRRATTAELNVQEEAQAMQASATANIQNDGTT